ncbi:DNA primase [Flavobacterium sp.]|uniref:DNA primase n=1 Tax=Flavobacterium sp. TaxID=239 RepID=UPI0026332BA8|nr:DNA primase [Flavobacterium sp.]MDD3005068.1 DNA primase [Flavobacterium sp.]
MKRVIVDYAKLTNEILNLLVERFPDGYDDSNIIRFRNAKNELVEAVEVRTEDTIYLVKVSTKLATRLENFDEDEIDDVVAPLETIKGLEIEDEDLADDDDDEDDMSDKPEFDDEDDEDANEASSDDDDDEEDDE